MLVLCLPLATGCKSEPASSSSPTARQTASGQKNPAISATDPCPERLHDLAGALLNFMLQYNRLPPSLEDLAPLTPNAPLALTCPISGQKYIYNPTGIKLPPSSWAIVYDAAPSHSQMRWAIVFSPGREGQTPVPAVVSVSETEFRKATEFPSLGK